MKQELLKHTINPFVQSDSKVLILGTFPSPKSREVGFYYGHPQNRFWKVLAKLFNTSVPKTIDEKKEFLRKYKIALWDVLESCKITGASDSSIKDPKPNNINELLDNSDIKYIFTTGNKAYQLYKKYCQSDTGIKAVKLPSTSPANCAMNMDKLLEKYKIIKDYLN